MGVSCLAFIFITFDMQCVNTVYAISMYRHQKLSGKLTVLLLMLCGVYDILLLIMGFFFYPPNRPVRDWKEKKLL